MPIKLLTQNDKGELLTPTPFEIISKMKAEYEAVLYPLANGKLRQRRPNLPNIKDALSAWVSRKELEALLTDNNANGMRIYYGIHYVSTGDLNPNLDNLGRHNVILVATIDNVAPGDPTTENSADQLKQSADPATANSVITSGSFDGMGGDQLPLCPPRCPTTAGL